jgi:glycosyltransferase 2 family protein
MARSRLWIAVQAVVTVALLALLARTIDLASLRALFVRLPAWFYFLSLAVVLGGQIVYAWRWWLLLTGAGVGVPFVLVVRQYFVAVFINNFLPSSVGGDVAKIYYLGRDHGYRTVAASVVVDRLLGLGVSSLAASAALWLSQTNAPPLIVAQVALAMIAAASILLLVLTATGTGGLAARVVRLGAPAVTLAERLQRMRLDVAVGLRRPAVVVLSAIAVVGYAIVIAAIYGRFVALQDAAVPRFVAMFGAVTATTVLSNIPISLNGLGLREQLHASLLAALGIAPELAVAISLLLYAHLIVASLVGLVLWLNRPRLAAAEKPNHSTLYS